MDFEDGLAYGIDQLLEPPGLGAHCDSLVNKTIRVSVLLRLKPFFVWFYLENRMEVK